MAVTAKLYGNAFVKMANKEVDLDTDTIKMALLGSGYTPDQDAHDYFNDLTNEITGTGYTAGGVTLANKAVSYTGASNVFKFTSDPAAWSTATFSGVRYYVLYVSTGTGSTSALLAYGDFGADQSVTASTFSVTPDASDGWFKVTVA